MLRNNTIIMFYIMWLHTTLRINGLHTKSRAVSPAQERETLPFPTWLSVLQHYLTKNPALNLSQAAREGSSQALSAEICHSVMCSTTSLPSKMYLELSVRREEEKKKEKQKPICSAFWWAQASRANSTQEAVQLLGKIQSTRKDRYVNGKIGGTKISSTFLCKNQCSRVYFHESGNTTATFFSGND